MPDSIDASDAMIDNWTKRLEENAARYQALADRMQGQQVTERSTDGSVQVTVDSRGLLQIGAGFLDPRRGGRQRMAQLGQSPIDFDRMSQAPRGNVVMQAARFQPRGRITEQTMDMMHRQMVLRDDDGGCVWCVVERDSRASAGMRNLQVFDASERNQIRAVRNADTRYDDGHAAARRRAEHELLRRGVLRDD